MGLVVFFALKQKTNKKMVRKEALTREPHAGVWLIPIFFSWGITHSLTHSLTSNLHGFSFSHHCLVSSSSLSLCFSSLTHSLITVLIFIDFRGSGEDGQLGIGNNEEKEWVCVVKALETHRFRSVVAGSRNSLAIADDGKVYSFFISLFLFSSICS